MVRSDAKNGTVLGLVGPVCAGKSEVSRLLRERGAEVYEADAFVRELYERPEVARAVSQLFGEGVLDGAGRVDRRAIARRVFGASADRTLLRRLTEEILFPRTGEELRDRIERFRGRARPGDVLVVDAPTLFESGRADWCDKILLVTAPPERRRAWAVARGWKAGDVDERDAAMLPESDKRRHADQVIDNSGTLADLERAVDRVWSDRACRAG